jgi:tripartite-type tricarboxylate transporter receptor subunit TctC
MRLKFIAAAGLALSLWVCASAGFAADGNYPAKPVAIITDAPKGSGPDVAVSIVAAGLTARWGVQAVVVNHPGANGSIAVRAALDAAPDGNTLFAATLATFVTPSGVAPNLPITLPHDFLPIGLIHEQPMLVAVSPTLGVGTLRELIDRATKKPGQISIAVTGTGRLTHLTGQLLQQEAHIDLLAVPYTRGPMSAIGDVGSGRVSMMIEGYAGLAGAAQAGQVKLIAVASPQRVPEFPDLPTVAETIPGFVAEGFTLLLAPVGTPQSVINKASADLNAVVSDPAIKRQLASTGNYTRVMTADETRSFVAQQQKTWLPIAQQVYK